MCTYVCGNTQLHRIVVVSDPSFNIGSHPATAVFCASGVCVRGNRSYTPQMSVSRGGVGLFPSQNRRSSRLNCIRSLASYRRLCRRPVDPRRAGRAPSMLPRIPAVMAAFIRGFAVRVNVYVYVFASLPLSFLCSGF